MKRVNVYVQDDLFKLIMRYANKSNMKSLNATCNALLIAGLQHITTKTDQQQLDEHTIN